jgi:hypothetical protein
VRVELYGSDFLAIARCHAHLWTGSSTRRPAGDRAIDHAGRAQLMATQPSRMVWVFRQGSRRLLSIASHIMSSKLFVVPTEPDRLFGKYGTKGVRSDRDGSFDLSGS